eukprot:Nitzschia sp. Nitz4//scaffold110_size71422//56770//59455//NITZ4_005882-RA/size71422-augustus-gene-0.14-mRNA-1//1//CDS//3329533113//3662//frame0
MHSAVRSRIASYEAHNQDVRRYSPSPSRKDPSTRESPSASPMSTRHTAIAASKARDRQRGDRNNDPEGRRAASPSTVVASQSRVSRMRQEQYASTAEVPEADTQQSKHTAPAAVDRRKLIKERRAQQQKKVNTHPAHQDSGDHYDHPSARSDYRPDAPVASDQTGGPKATTPLHQAATPVHHNETTSKPLSARISKMQRMQKMKSHTDTGKTSTTAPVPVVQTPTSAATSPSPNNERSAPRRQRHNSIQKSRARRKSDTPAEEKKIEVQTPDGFPPNRTPTRDQGSISSAHLTSPVSETGDIYGPPTDHSVDPTTDDEATLTSVRRIMARDGSDLNYHVLQPKPAHNDDASYSYASKWHDSSASQGYADGGRPMGRSKRESRTKWNSSDAGSNPGVFQTAYSSDYETDGEISKTSKQSNMLDGPSQSQATDVNEFFSSSKYPGNRRPEDDDRTFEYGDRDDEDNLSASHIARLRRENEALRNGISYNNQEPQNAVPSSLINQEDFKHYTKELGTPSSMAVGLAVAGAATIGCLALGPASLFVGAAAVGVGVGVMQIPDEERNKMQERLQKAVGDYHDKAVDATEKLSNSCAAGYEESGMAEHLPQCLSLTGLEGNGIRDTESLRSERKMSANDIDSPEPVSKGNPKIPAPVPQVQEALPRAEVPPSMSERPRNKNVACLRNARILPIGQIYGLDPAVQPKAWLDVVASVNTTEDERNEALEEILILSKDKKRARILLDEGILDSILWIVDRYMEKTIAKEKGWSNGVVSPNEKRAVKLAATCCITLGKTHCAAIHTEGDLQLMSLYDRGSVPEERQVAQMLHEVAHHVRTTNTTDPTIVVPSKEVFALRKLSLLQAEDLALTIKQIADGTL